METRLNRPERIGFIAQVDFWFFVFARYKRETQGFGLDIQDLTQKELTCMSLVYREFLDFAPHVLQAVSQRRLPEVRRAIAYLNQLSALQYEAWQQEIADGEAAADLIRKAVESKDPEEKARLYEQCQKIYQHGSK